MLVFSSGAGERWGSEETLHYGEPSNPWNNNVKTSNVNTTLALLPVCNFS